MTELELKAKLFQKLLGVKKQVTYLKKNTQGFNFEYASPELVLGTLNPLLNEAGLFLKVEVTDESHERVFSKYKMQDIYVGGKKEQREVEVYETLYHLHLLFTWVDTETGFEDSARFTASGINNDEQGQGSAQTYAERYFLLKTFQIPTGKDDPDALSLKRQEGTPAEKPKATAPETAAWITDAQVSAAIKKIEAGEEGVLEGVLAKYKVSKANRAKLEAAKPTPVDATPDDSTPTPEKEDKPTQTTKKAAVKKTETPVLDAKAEAIDDKGNIKPNDAFVEELMNERQAKALAFFKPFEGPDWIRVAAYSKVALKDKPDVAAIAFACKDAKELVTKLSIEDALAIASALKEAEEKKKKEG